MNKHLLLSGALACAVFAGAQAQTRYLDDVFTRGDVVRTTTVEFGQNYYFLNFPPAPSGTSSSNPQIGPLHMDLYTPPANDTATARPLVVYLHTGSFLPKYINGQTTGNNRDSAVVELGYRFAQKGYMFAAVNYRLGWNPLAPTQIQRTGQILNAVYRAIHDAQTCVRFFKKDAATTNTYKVDPNRIFVFGQGSGGYASLAYAFLNKQSETELPKFLDAQGNSVINTALVGDVTGQGGAVNVYNHAGYSNQVAMVANIGGSLGDISWMEGDWTEVPVAGIHCRKDIFAPYDSGTVIVPTTQQPVVFVHGSRTAVQKAVTLGINDIWVNYNFTDPISQRAYDLNPKNTSEGLFQIERPDIGGGAQEGSPWEWWDSATVVTEAALVGQNGTTIHNNSKLTNPDMSKMKAMSYLDTIVGYLAPRMYQVMLDPTLSTENNGGSVFEHTIYPNPATDFVRINVLQDNEINSLEVFDLSGKKVLAIANLKGINTYTANVSSLQRGIYLFKYQTKKGSITKKVLLQ